MTKKQWLIAIVLVDFMAFNAYVLARYGYVGFLRELVSSLVGIQVLVDLTIALVLIAVWMWNDAKRRGITAVPYLVVGVFLGSVGPLLYLLRTTGSAAAEPVRGPVRVSAR
jgi:hypothetical protein